MKRLTTEEPQDNFETMMNYVYSKDGWAYIRHDGVHEDVPLTQWARRQCAARGGADEDLPGDTPEEIDEALCGCMMDCPDCPIALAYCFASQAVHLRDRLKRYEDTGLMPMDITPEKPACVFYSNRRCNLNGDWCAEGPGCPWEIDSGIAMRLLAPPNAPLTLEELREMDGEPVWIIPMRGSGGFETWMLVDAKYELCREAHGGMAVFENCGKTWLAYRRRPKEGTIF